MSIQDWSDQIVVAELAADPALTDDLTLLIEKLEKDPKDIVLSFTQVKFLNSSNLSLLLKLRKNTLDANHKLLLCHISTQVWGVFLLTGLDALFDVAEDTASALASLQMKQ